jgi:hypothetical protein
MDVTSRRRPDRRRLATWTAGSLAVLLLLLASAPLVMRGRVDGALRGFIQGRVDAEVTWGRASLTLLRDFPDLTLQVHDVAVVGVAGFTGDTLLTVGRARLALDLPSVWRAVRHGEAVVVRAFSVDQPDVRLLVREDGVANWDIMRAEAAPSDPAGAESAHDVRLTLRALAVRDGSVTLDDRHAGIQASVAGLRHSLGGDVARSRFTLRSLTSAEAVSFRFAGIPYLSEAGLEIRADLDVDAAAGRVELRENRIRLNDLVLELAGSVARSGENVALDLAFDAPGADFREILSLVPAVYAREFEAVRTGGTMAASGWVRGEYGTHAFPELAMEVTVRDGTFRYPDLPLPARDIALDLAVTNPGGSLDRTEVDIRRFRLVLGDDPVEGTLRLRNPVSDPEVHARLLGRIDLADLGRTVKLEGVEELAGVVVADATVTARGSDLDAGRYDRIGADGTVTIAGLVLRAIDLPHPLLIDEARLRLTPSHAELSDLRGSVGSTDLSLSGRLDNLLGFALRGEELRGSARVASRHVALDEWRSDDEARAVPVPGNIDFVLDAAVDRITFGDLDMRDARGRLAVRSQRVTLDDFHLAMLGGGVRLTGYYETLDPARPAFDLDFGLTDLDVTQAFAGLTTVQAFAPVARYAVGRVSADLRLNGSLRPDLVPVLEVLSGLGSLRTAGLRLQDFPPLDQLAETLQIPLFRDPGFVDFRSTVVIRDGRLHVSPFDLGFGDAVMTVAGSNGLDASLDYTLGLQVPRALLGSGAEGVVTRLVAETGRAGFRLQPADVLSLGAALTGTVTRPAVAVDFRGLAAGAGAGVRQALQEEAVRRVEAMEERLDAAAEEARLRIRAEAERTLAEAERRGDALRSEARALADVVRREGEAQADELLARATSPAARLAARPAADRVRRETAERADRIVREADARADAILEEARARLRTDA